ncbi:methionine ABC transporter ATP-binding protein [Corticimicrobacter populi]
MIELSHLTKHYRTPDGGMHAALAGVSLQVRKGEVFGIIGRSGAGKSTLIRMINLLERPDAGSVRIGDEDITGLQGAALRQLRQRIGMVFQHFNLLDSRTVFENVRFPLRLAGVSRREAEQRVAEVLALVGLEGQQHKYPRQLSGGQRQRVGIARALANRPEVLLCDEATSALDPETTQAILKLLMEINQQLGLTIVLITHGMDVIRRICDRVAVIEGGRIVEEGPVVDVFLHPRHEVTQALLAESGIDAQGWEALAEGVNGRLVRLSFREDAIAQPVLSRISRDLALDLSILQGSVGRIKNTAYGQLVLAVSGTDAALAQLPEVLAREGIEFEELKA